MSFSVGDSSLGSASKEAFGAQKLAPHRSACVPFPDQVEKHLQAFYLSRKQLVKIKDSMQAAMEKGLKKPNQGGPGALPMVPTYVCSLPDGTGKCILQ